MTNDELKTCMLHDIPVVYEDVDGVRLHYDRVSGIIYRKIDGRLRVVAELADVSGNSVRQVLPDKVFPQDDIQLWLIKHLIKDKE